MTPEQQDLVTQAITGTFMWSFKKGDNIIYNFEVIWELYAAQNRASLHDKNKYHKPIVLLQVSIIECILDDFVNRVVGHVRDQIPNITHSQINDFKTKKRDKLEHYIAAAKRHNLFDAEESFYTDMDTLRKARNRFHIQNSKHTEPADESNLFTTSLVNKSELIFEIVLERMMTKFFRGPALRIEFADVPLPWSRITPIPDVLVEDDEPWLCIGCTTLYSVEVPYCPNCALLKP